MLKENICETIQQLYATIYLVAVTDDSGSDFKYDRLCSHRWFPSPARGRTNWNYQLVLSDSMSAVSLGNQPNSLLLGWCDQSTASKTARSVRLMPAQLN
jgi:hypothetical protein